MRTALAPLDKRIESFARNVEFSESGCWLWSKSLHATGYGQLGPGYGVTRYAHRWLWLHTVGPIAPGLELDHLCRVRHCVNPDHLEPVTKLENSQRGTPYMVATKRKQQQERLTVVTHCPSGRHEFTPDNSYFHPTRGYRICRECHKASARAWRENRRSA